ncbi:MAG: zinc ABC transporter substrate-binding protein [Verrucomicrobia bacterium]|nr:zinc ABC transporter substrate-binding protein [Verrucomicrobiota bacterium]
MLIRLLLLLTCVLPLTSCEKAENSKSGKPTVLVSIPPYIYFVDKIAHGAVEIETLIPPGANPHIYEATPREVQRHQSAALWVYLGESFDKRALKFFRDSQAPIRIIDVAHGIKLLSYCEEEEAVTQHHHCHHHSHDEGQDLHIWLSPSLAKQQANRIAEGLIALLPEKKEEFTANLQAFLSELDQLNEQITTLLAPMKGSAILVSHPAFAYFCRDYHLVQLSIEIEGKDPLPQHVTEILAQAKNYKVQSVLTEPQYSNKGAELIAESLHLPTHMVDPYAENYSENLLKIAQVIAE